MGSSGERTPRPATNHHTETMDKLSYALGLGIGQQLKQMGLKDRLAVSDFAQSVADVLQGNELKVKNAEAQQIVNQFFEQEQARQSAEKAAAGKQALEEGRAFLANNASRPGVQTTKSGLQYEVLQEGTGRKPKSTDQVRCHYEGTLINGQVFDSSYQRNEPAVFGLQQVIAGWTEGLQLMSEGSKFRFFIPYRLGYGENGAGQLIPPFATLIFDVELLEVL